jgi:hypothetical protein
MMRRTIVSAIILALAVLIAEPALADHETWSALRYTAIGLAAALIYIAATWRRQ